MRTQKNKLLDTLGTSCAPEAKQVVTSLVERINSHVSCNAEDLIKSMILQMSEIYGIIYISQIMGQLVKVEVQITEGVLGGKERTKKFPVKVSAKELVEISLDKAFIPSWSEENRRPVTSGSVKSRKPKSPSLTKSEQVPAEQMNKNIVPEKEDNLPAQPANAQTLLIRE